MIAVQAPRPNLVGSDPTDQLDTLPGRQDRRIVHVPIDAGLQQEVGESPDIVQHHREHEVEQPNAVILRGGLRQEGALDRLVLVFDLPAVTVPATEGFGLVRAGSEIRREDGCAIAVRRWYGQHRM